MMIKFYEDTICKKDEYASYYQNDKYVLKVEQYSKENRKEYRYNEHYAPYLGISCQCHLISLQNLS
jgi:hypothetical protein